MLLWILTAQAADLSFHLGRGPERVEIVDGRLNGVPVQLRQAVVVRAEPTADLSHPAIVARKALPGKAGRWRLAVAEGADPREVANALFGRPGVVFAHPELAWLLQPTTVPNDPYLGDQWHLESVGQAGALPGADVHAFPAWEQATGRGQLIAVLDSGFQLDHPDLNLRPGYDAVDGDREPWFDLADGGAPHGTACAGLAAARGNNGLGVAGVAWEAEVLGVRMLGGYVDSTGIYTAIVDSVDQGATVLSNSWGYYAPGCPPIGLDGIMEDALDYVLAEGRGGLGAVYVQASGNDGCDSSQNALLQHEAVIAVGALNRWDTLEGYSNYGTMQDVVAPAGGVLTTDLLGGPGYGAFNGDEDYTPNMNGTSAATPLVSGTVALMLEANPRLTAREVRRILCETAVRVDPQPGQYDALGWGPRYGCGKVDAAAAVAAVAAPPPGAPTLLGPGEFVSPEAIVLTWSSPEGTPATGWRIEAWPIDDPTDLEEWVTDVPHLDLTSEVDEGEAWTWRVIPFDRWGDGSPSVEATFTAALPEPAAGDTAPAEPEPGDEDEGKGCQTGGFGSGFNLGLVGLAGLLLRRRASHNFAQRPRSRHARW